jgi:hypothetical protein
MTRFRHPLVAVMTTPRVVEVGVVESRTAEGLLVVAEEGVVPADRVEAEGLPGLVVGGLVKVLGLKGVVEGLGVAALPLPQAGEVVVSVGVPDQVAGLGG